MRRLGLSIVLVMSGLAAGESSAEFIRKPTVAREGENVRISFSVSRETDVAVYVEDAQNQIVRHVAAGVLGKNAPEPLKPGSLDQTVVWDGKDDDGKTATGGPFKVRVGLGLKASWGGLAFADSNKTGPNRIESVMGLNTGLDGRLYVMDMTVAWLYWGSSKIHVFRRDGSYEKTIKPFPSNLPFDRVKASNAFINSFGSVNPIIHRAQGFSFYTHDDVAQQPAVTPDGRIVLATRSANTTHYDTGPIGKGHLAMIDTDGGVPEACYAGPDLTAGWTTFPYLASTTDGKGLYIAGMGAKGSWESSKPWHAVYRVKLPERGPQEVFFGDPDKAGSDQAHLNDPRGLASDGKGHLLVSDFGNGRVVVMNESDKGFAGSFAVPAPAWLAVHPKTGVVYVQSGDAVIKFSGWSDAKEVSRLTLPKRENVVWRLALDGSDEPAVLWAGCKTELVRYEDSGAKFSAPAPAGCVATQFFWRPASDPTRKLIGCRVGGSWNSRFNVLDEATGLMRVIGGVEGSEGRTHRLGPDGSIYAVEHALPVIRYDRDGKPRPFAATANDAYLKGRLPAGNTGTTAWERDFWVDRKGDIYVRRRGPEYHGSMTVEVYDADGNFKRTALWSVSDAMYGPRVDSKGNIYIMDMIKPLGELFPKEFQGRLMTSRSPHWYDWIYGSVIKFGPAGGAIWFAPCQGARTSPVTYEGWGVVSRDGNVSVSDLRTTGGSLTGTIAQKPAGLSLPLPPCVDAATQKKLVMRLKNDSDGNQAEIQWLVTADGIEGAPRRAKAIEIKPHSDFTEYTFDLSGDANWKGSIRWLTMIPTNGSKGSFAIDWVRIGDAGSKLVWNFDKEDSPDKKLPAEMKKQTVASFGAADGNQLQGAQWYRSGFSPVGAAWGNDHCHCTGSDFDVDDFGRVFAPDTGRFRVAVLDTNGNEIMSFGAYGNQDFCGPDSYVADPDTKLLRPRKDSDPKELVSPFAKPEIAFGWIVGLAVTDKYTYVDDVINKRILRVKLDYSEQEICALQ